MFNTVFGSMEEFVYGKTCTENTFGYTRKGKGVVSNFISNKLRLPNLAIGVATIAVTLSSAEGSYGALPQDIVRLREGSHAGAARPDKIDERSRQELVKRLSKVRDDFALTQDDVAKLIYISKSTLSKLERGEHSPDSTNLEKYTKFLFLADYLQTKLKGKKFAIRQLFKTESRVFDGMNPIEFAHAIGEEGLNEVIYTLKRQYG